MTGMPRGGGMRRRGWRSACAAALAIVVLGVTPSFADTDGGAGAGWWPGLDGVSTLSDLEGFIQTLQQSLQRLTAWIRLFQEGTSDILTRLIAAAPGLLPDETGLTAFLSVLSGLPPTFQAAMQAVANKLIAPVAPGSIDARHHDYIESSATLIDEASGIAGTDEVVAGALAQQQSGAAATMLAADAAAGDLRPVSVTLDAAAASDVLTSSAQNLPSSRAGIELLVAGTAAALQQNATLGAAQADRLTVLIQQAAQLSQQMHALGTTQSALAVRQAEEDRRTLSAQLGLADAAATAAQVLQDALSGAGTPPEAESVLQPLY